MSAIQRFQNATDYIYGPLDADEHSWVPPERSGGHRGRYLWTDAFGVINFLTLSRELREPAYLDRAVQLANTVHNALGRTRDGTTWLPGASDELPVGGGLRIGKQGESGSDGDGQYHHYFTLWMFALNRLSHATNDKTHNERAISLAKAIHPYFFVDRDTPRPRMLWKIAMDRSRPLVQSQGNSDPIDGLVVFRKLQAASSDSGVLAEEIADYERIIELKGNHFVSTDTLDLGMTLWTSHWLKDNESYFNDLHQQAEVQLRKLFDRGYLEKPTSRRLAFREYGTALGIGCIINPDDDLQSYRTEIIETWERHLSSTPEDLRPISEVMRAAAIIPGAFKKGYLGPEPDA
jgi:hypothetical protein